MRTPTVDRISTCQIFDYEVKRMLTRYLYSRSDRDALDRVLKNARYTMAEFSWCILSQCFTNLTPYDERTPLTDFFEEIKDRVGPSKAYFHSSDVLTKKSDIFEVDLSGVGINVADFEVEAAYGAQQERFIDRLSDAMVEIYRLLELDSLRLHTDPVLIVFNKKSITVTTYRHGCD